MQSELCLWVNKSGPVFRDWTEKLKTKGRWTSTSKPCIDKIETQTSDSSKIKALEDQLVNIETSTRKEGIWAKKGITVNKEYVGDWRVPFPSCEDVVGIGESKVLKHDTCYPGLFIRVPISVPQPSLDTFPTLTVMATMFVESHSPHKVLSKSCQVQKHTWSALCLSQWGKLGKLTRGCVFWIC